MEKEKRIILYEEDEIFGSLLKEYLKTTGFRCDLFLDDLMVWEIFKEKIYDICIIDLTQTFNGGYDLVKKIRLVDTIPIIILSPNGDKSQIMEGFKIGIDDYIIKPVCLEELYYRINAILRPRAQFINNNSNTICFGQFNFNPGLQILRYESKNIKLTTKETELLRLLCTNINTIVERRTALNLVWGVNSYFNARSLDIYISKLRKHLKHDESVQIINIHGSGYKLIVD